MSDAFLPGNGFDTYETQDKVLVSMDGSVDCGVVVRILQQQGFGVAGLPRLLALSASCSRQKHWQTSPPRCWAAATTPGLPPC